MNENPEAHLIAFVKAVQENTSIDMAQKAALLRRSVDYLDEVLSNYEVSET